MSKVDKINFCMLLQQVNSAYVMSVLTKWSYFVSFPIFGVIQPAYYASIVNQQFSDRFEHKFTQVYFSIAKPY